MANLRRLLKIVSASTLQRPKSPYQMINPQRGQVWS